MFAMFFNEHWITNANHTIKNMKKNSWILIGPLIGPFEGLHAYKNLLEH